MVEQKPRDMNFDKTCKMIEDALRCIEGNDSNEQKTNQELIEMQQTFREYAIKAQKGVIFS